MNCHGEYPVRPTYPVPGTGRMLPELPFIATLMAVTGSPPHDSLSCAGFVVSVLSFLWDSTAFRERPPGTGDRVLQYRILQ